MHPTEHRGRLAKAIADCDRFIDLESPRAADLRPPEIQQLLEWTISHRARLQARLEAV
jgi:hypothetical protein